MGTNTPNENIFSVVDINTGKTLPPEQLLDKKQNLDNTQVSFDLEKVKELVGKLQKLYGDKESFGRVIAGKLIEINESLKQPNINRVLLVGKLQKLNAGYDLAQGSNRTQLLQVLDLSSLQTAIEKSSNQKTNQPPAQGTDAINVQNIKFNPQAPSIGKDSIFVRAQKDREKNAGV